MFLFQKSAKVANRKKYGYVNEMESAADLREKLATYQGQLEQVHQLLEIDSSNEQFLSLKEDLEKVISLTQTLLVQVAAQESHLGPTQFHDNNDNTKTKSAENDTGSYSPGQADDASDQEGGTLATTITTIAKKFVAGDRIEVLGGARVFSGVVTRILNDTECHIRYYEFPDSEVTLPMSSLQAIPAGQLRKEQVAIGFTGQCKYATDQQYYAATVTGITPYGYLITYTEYGNVEEVPLEYLRPLTAVTAVSAETSSSSATNTKDNNDKLNPAKKEDTLTVIPIPENLEILPTDTEEEKRKKYKKLKSIKNKNYHIQQELQVKEVQQSWQKFVSKGAKRPLLSGIGHKTSIFTSSDDSSSKIGVVNSGKGMTNYGDRKRFKHDTGGQGDTLNFHSPDGEE